MSRPTSIAADDRGFTLIEILVAIVLVGILSAVAVVGVGRLTDQAATASCTASADAARTAVTSYLAITGANPSSFGELTQPIVMGVAPSATVAAPLAIPANATVAGRTITLGGWRLTMSTATPPTFACTTITLNTVVVTAAQLNGWSIFDDSTGTTVHGSPGQFVSGPATPPAGSGSTQLTLDGTTQGSAFGNASFGSIRLDKLTNLTYSSYQQVGTLAAVVSFDVQFRPTDTGYAGRLVFLPTTPSGTVTNAWQTWSPLDGLWYASHSSLAEPQSSQGNCVMSVSQCTWAQVLQKFPDATISPVHGVIFKAGSNWPASSYNVDKFVMGVADNTGKITETTYDFGG